MHRRRTDEGAPENNRLLLMWEDNPLDRHSPVFHLSLDTGAVALRAQMSLDEAEVLAKQISEACLVFRERQLDEEVALPQEGGQDDRITIPRRRATRWTRG